MAGVNYLVRPATTILAGGGGNKHRLITYIRLEKQIVYIKAMLHHRDYDKGAWKS
jgi:mRNA-degrading endonuclease HigB of HigAB toxin-antitoxin module